MGWRFDLHPDRVAGSANDSTLEGNLFAVSHRDGVSWCRVESPVAFTRTATDSTFDDEVWADLVGVVGQIVGSATLVIVVLTFFRPTWIFVGSEKCRWARAKWAGVGSEKTTVQWGWSFVGKIGNPSPSRSDGRFGPSARTVALGKSLHGGRCRRHLLLRRVCD